MLGEGIGLFGAIIVGIISIVILIISADFIVKHLIRLAHHWGVSETFVGLTVLSIGTSLPEIGSHVMASIGINSGTLDYKIASGLVLGANIGSDVIQQTLIVGVVVLLGGTLVFSKEFLKQSYGMMVGTTLMCLLLGWDGVFSRLDGLILITIFFGYLYYLYRNEHKHHHLNKKKEELSWSVGITILFVCGAMGLLLLSSLYALSATELVVAFTGVGGSLIGVVSLGIASALPEMLTALSGLRNKSVGVSVGTLIGSNITNPLVAIGLGSLISTYFVPRPLVYWDLPMETITAVLLLIWLLFNKRKLGRGGAIYLIIMYLIYLLVRIFVFNTD